MCVPVLFWYTKTKTKSLALILLKLNLKVLKLIDLNDLMIVNHVTLTY